MRLDLRKVIAALAMLAGLAVTLPAAAHAQNAGYQLDGVSPSSASVGQTVNVYVNGCAPGSTATISLRSPAVVLGTATAGADGVVNTNVQLPSNATTGANEIVVTCTDRDAAQKTVQLALTITSPSSNLPGTGADIGLTLAVAAIAIGLGASLVVGRRQRATVEAA